MDLEEYQENKNWNIQGFREVDKVIDILKDYADDNNIKHHFQIGLSEAEKDITAKIQFNTTVLTIILEK